ncbi:hypothetical protein RSAG8_01302, partial [Rhizoctonia solani AG-8 WAC10335]
MSNNRVRVNTSNDYGLNRRTGSPPAQAYFETSAEGAPHPVSPEAGSHFAYSTTLRRHGVGDSPATGRSASLEAASGFVEQVWNNTWNKDKESREDGHGEEGGIELALKGRDDTLSAKYASTSPEDTLRDFRSDPTNGLTTSAIPALRATFGYNEFSVSAPEPAWLKFAKTIYESHLILLLFGSAAISALLGNFDDAVSITVAILIVVTVGYVQERRSEESLAALNKLVPHHCHIIRDGQQVHLLANELVPGDLVTFQVGDRIPADIRILTSLELEIDESSLTGETHPARKSIAACPPRAALGERTSIAFMGTLVRNGRGTGIVISTGTATEFGSVFSLMQSVEEKRTPLQTSMDELAHKLSMLSFGVIGVICLIGVMQQRGWLEMFTIGVSLAVAAIPEGLPIVTTVTLALGVLRMARRKAIVKKLPSVEALGSVSVTMMDPPRKGVSEAIAQLHAGGVKVVMITGDAVHTAQSIAHTIGLRTAGVGASAGLGMGLDMSARIGMGGIGLGPLGGGTVPGSCLTGAEIDAMDDRSLMERVSNVTVFARTTPRHKMRIVKAYQQRGEVVAMTGDGVNDAPALKMADIGVSMGKSGTDVAKEAADVILVDDNFSTILSAVEEGKHIFYNIQNFLSFQLSTAVAALTLITLSTMFRMSNPLNAMQILFINILMDGPPSQSLGVDPVDRTVMKRPPRRKDEPIITQRIVGRVLFSASAIVLGTLFVYAHELSDGSMSRRDQTMTFTCFVFLDLASALQNRGINCGFLQNQMLIATVSVSFLVQLGLIYIPLFQSVFQTEALAFHDLSVLLCLGAVSMGLHEFRRRWERKANKELDALYSGGIGDVV